MSETRNDIPSINSPNFNQRVRETLMVFLGRQGNPLDRGLTLRDMLENGLVKIKSGFSLKPGSSGSIPLEPGTGLVDTYEPDLTPPPTPTGFTATAAISNIIVEHDAPLYTQGHGHLRTRLYGKIVNTGDPLPTFADAAEITQFTGTVHAQPTNPATTWRLWIKWETVDGVISTDPAGGTNGLEVTTGQDVSSLLTALTGEITEGQLYQDLQGRINLIDGPASLTGSVNARVAGVQAQVNTINAELAQLTQTPAYEVAVTYDAGDLVTYNGGLYKALQTTTGNLPTNTTYWEKIGDYASLSDAVAAHAAQLQDHETRISTTESGLTAEVSARQQLAAQVATNTAGIQSEAAARANADSALSSTINSVSAVANAKNKTYYQTTAPASGVTAGDLWFDSDDNNKAYRYSGSAWVATDDTRIAANIAAITAEQTARANADSALASDITTLSATVTGSYSALNAAIQNEATARANADAAVSRSVSTLQASAGTGGLIYNGSFANGSAEGWAGLYSVTNAPYGGLPKAYAGVQNTRDIFFPNADASQWMACKPNDEFEVSAWVSAQAASPRYGIGIQYERTNGNTETWTLLDTVTAPTPAKFLRGYWTAPSDARRVRFWGQIDTFGTENAWHITDVQLRRTDARTSANTAAIQTEATVRASQTGELYAKYGVKLDVNGYVTGWAMNNNGSTGDMIVLADKFAVGAPGGGNVIPFVVNTTEQTINGVTVPVGTYMDAAYIKNGTITNVKIGNAAIDDAKIANLSASKLTAGSIAVGQYIQSAGYVAGSAGWRINGNGNAELSNATVRGTVYATNGQFWGTLLGGAASSYSSGLGFYAGGGTASDGANYRWRVGSPTGARIQWNGSAIEVYNASNQLTISSGGISASYVSGLGTLATQNSVSTSQVTGLGTLATQNAVNWNTQITNIPAFGNFAYLNSITSANISTYIASAAIGTAYIANGAITQAKIGDAQVNTLQIAGNAVTASSTAYVDSTSSNSGTIYSTAASYTNSLSTPITIMLLASGRTGLISGNATFGRRVWLMQGTTNVVSSHATVVADTGEMQWWGDFLTLTALVTLPANTTTYFSMKLGNSGFNTVSMSFNLNFFAAKK